MWVALLEGEEAGVEAVEIRERVWDRMKVNSMR